MAPRSRLPLSERLRPTRLDEVIGNAKARSDLRAWAERWSRGGPPAQRAAILSGPPGVGKTSAALAVAADFGWSVVEMNASDARNERAIEQVAGRASLTRTLLEAPGSRTPGRGLILLDEADSLSGRVTEAVRVAPSVVPLREFLRGRYGTVEALNGSWGLSPGAKPAPFETWELVPRSPGNHAWARLPPARKDIDDWRTSGRPRDSSDRGGIAAIARLVRATRQPLVLTVNDDRPLTRYSPVFRTAVTRVRFYAVPDRELQVHLEAIVRQEKIDLAPGALDAIVRRARGDVRAALNDLDALSPLPAGPHQLEVLGTRDVEVDFGALVEEVLSTARFYRNGEVRDRLDAPPDDLLPWIEENLPYFATDAAHLSAAVDRLAAAERLLAWARRYRVWGLWSYASEVLTGGTGLAVRDRPVTVSGRARFPAFLGQMGSSRSARAMRESVVRAGGARFHVSRNKSRETMLPFLEDLFYVLGGRGNDPASMKTARTVVRALELSAEQLGFLLGTQPESHLVLQLLDRSDEVADAQEPEAPAADEAPDPARTVAADESPEPGRRKVQRSLTDFGSR